MAIRQDNDHHCGTGVPPMPAPARRRCHNLRGSIILRFYLALMVAAVTCWGALRLSTVHAAEPTATAPAPADLTPKASPAEAETILTPVQPAPSPASKSPATQPEQAPPAQPGVAAAPAQDAEGLEVLIAQALDQPTDLNVQEVPIRQAIDQLAANTGIPIKLMPGCLSLLPYGSQTKLSATIQKRPLGESLTALLRPLGLEFVPAGKEVIIQPTPPLARIGRRATWDELGILEKLYAQAMTPELVGSLHFQFQDTAGADAAASQQTLAKLVQGVGAGLAAQVLEHACDQRGWSWHPEGQVIAVLTKTKQIERQLESRVTLRYVQVSLTEALTDLGARAGVLVRFDPGVLASLPPQTAERFSLSMENATVRQALEVVAGETGLGYAIEPTGVRITRQPAAGAAPVAATMPAGGAMTAQIEATAQAAAAALRSNSIVGQVTFPLPDGSSFAFFIRQSDLPPEVNAMREAKIAKTVNQIRQRLHGEQQQD